MLVALNYMGLAGYVWLALFQLMLAVGLPLGKLAWGGQARVLPKRLRWASLASAGVAMIGAIALSQAAGLLAGPFPAGVLRAVLGALCLLFTFSIVGNALSENRPERLHGVPLASVLSLSSGVAAFG